MTQQQGIKKIVIIQGHPDDHDHHYGHALAESYIRGAQEAGHELKNIKVSKLQFAVLRTRKDWEKGSPDNDIEQAQEAIEWADHIAIFYPLWLGTMPALLKAFFEQVLRPGFAIDTSAGGKTWKKNLTGRSARIVITMGMPAFVYRWYFRAHSLKSLERNILGLCGIAPIKESLIGAVEDADSARHEKWLAKMHTLGRAGR